MRDYQLGGFKGGQGPGKFSQWVQQIINAVSCSISKSELGSFRAESPYSNISGLGRTCTGNMTIGHCSNPVVGWLQCHGINFFVQGQICTRWQLIACESTMIHDPSWTSTLSAVVLGRHLFIPSFIHYLLHPPTFHCPLSSYDYGPTQLMRNRARIKGNPRQLKF
jgi:hypothetical protein